MKIILIFIYIQINQLEKSTSFSAILINEYLVDKFKNYILHWGRSSFIEVF